MKAFRYVVYTWLLAHLIHSIVFLLIGFGGEFFLPFIIASFLFSIPSFLICLLFIQILPAIKVPVVANFFIWSLLVYTAIAASFCSVGLLFGDMNFLFEDVQFVLPSFIAATLALLIRFNQFEGLLIGEDPLNLNT